ncbi:MAG TPA: hypothetical protein VF801_07170 [Rhodocyclaceae bacterium]
MTNAYASYLRLLAIMFGTSLLALAGFNWLLDPYGVFDAPALPGINTVKHGYANHLRLAKAHAVARIRPRAVILGSSRAETAFDPGHPGFPVRPVYNLAMSGAGIYEMLRYLQHAESVRRLDLAVAVVDFFGFNAAWPVQPGFEESRLRATADGTPSGGSATDLLAALLSRDATADSWWELRHQRDGGTTYDPRTGLRDESFDAPAILAAGGYREAFRNNADYFVRYGYYPSKPPRPFAFADRQADSFASFRRLMDTAHANGTRLILVIPPVHAEQLELIHVLGLWPLLEQWKRNLAGLVADDAARHPEARACELWDFSGYNDITLEPVPAAGDAVTRMHWYREGSHFTRAAGDLVLDRILGTPGRAYSGPKGFGIRLDRDNVEQVLAAARAGRERWLASHAEVAADVARIAARYPQNHQPSTQDR